jgi:hypothetical protein
MREVVNANGIIVMSEKPTEFKTTVLEWLAKENED